MQIPTGVKNRVVKAMATKPELQAPFVQGGYEHFTNSVYMVKEATEEKESVGDYPLMSEAEKRNMPRSEESTSFNIVHLIDVLEILKKNGAQFVSVTVGETSIHLDGLPQRSTRKEDVKISALLMGLAK